MALITGSVQSEFHGLACGRHETTAITNYPFLCHVFFVDYVDFLCAVGLAHSFVTFGLWDFCMGYWLTFNTLTLPFIGVRMFFKFV
jgi:hypothetical protein